MAWHFKFGGRDWSYVIVCVKLEFDTWVFIDIAFDVEGDMAKLKKWKVAQKGQSGCQPVASIRCLLNRATMYRGGNKCLYVVARNFFLLLLNCSACPCLGHA